MHALRHDIHQSNSTPSASSCRVVCEAAFPRSPFCLSGAGLWVSLLVTQGSSSDLASLFFCLLAGAMVRYRPTVYNARLPLERTCRSRWYSPAVSLTCFHTYNNNTALSRPLRLPPQTLVHSIVIRKDKPDRRLIVAFQSHGLLHTTQSHNQVNPQPHQQTNMQYTTALILAVASLATAQSSSTTSSSASTSSATGVNQSGCGGAIDA